MMAQKGEEWLTLEDAAQLLGKSIPTLRYYISVGYIHSYRKPADRRVYVRYDELDAFVKQPPQLRETEEK